MLAVRLEEEKLSQKVMKVDQTHQPRYTENEQIFGAKFNTKPVICL